MNIKKTLAGIASYALVGAVAAGIGGTWAGLQKETYAANMMMTSGLDVVMHETQRNADKTGFEKFTQCQEILPSTFAKEGVEFAWAPENEWVTPSDYVAPAGADGNEWRVFDSNMQNVIDKFVTVENKGKSDAYVRTIIAYECPEGISDEYLRVNDNSGRTGVITNEILDDGKLVKINGTTYWVSTYTYKEALGKGETTIPSLKQVFLRSNATTEICEAFGDTVDILVISQAAQVGDYTDATTALDAAFGDVNEENVKEWFSAYSVPTIVESAEELTAALAKGGTVILKDDIAVGGTIQIAKDAKVELNMNGFDITVPEANDAGRSIYAIDNYGELTLTGKGTIEARGVENFGTMTIDSDDITIVARDANGGAAIWNEGVLTINGGTFTTATVDDGKMSDPGALNNQADGTVVINGGTFDANGALCYAIINSGNMTINNATVTGRHGAVANDGTLVIKNGLYACAGGNTSDHCIYYSGGTTTVYGGTFTHDREGVNGSKIFYDNGGTLVDNR